VYNTIDLDSTPADRGFGPGLFSVKRDGSGQRMLILPRPTEFFSEPPRIGVPPLEPDHAFLAVVRDGSDDVIVGQWRFANEELQSIVPKRLNVVTGRTTSVALHSPANVTGWLFDETGLPRVGVTIARGLTEVFWHPAADEPWKSLARFPEHEAPFVPIAVDRRGDLFIGAPSREGTSILETFDFAAGKPDGKPLVVTRGFDFQGVPVFDPETSRLLGVEFETDAVSAAWFDPAMKQLQERVDERFPGHSNELTCRRCTTDGVLLVHSYSDQDPGSYWVYRASDRSWESIGRSYTDIDPARMAQLDMFRIKARDGLELPVWVTTPTGPSTGPRPAIVLVHGGPWVRGVHWQWNPDAQFLASRGYVVIEPEFRGSTGYGRALLTRGFKQWGLAMQDDLADAVQWAAARGTIDPKRVCIAGASYGGYATLMGLVRHPDLYKCGVAWVAVTDPRLLFEDSWTSDVSQEAREFSLPVRLGDPIKDAALLKDAAPVEHAAEIRAPLLMAFGDADRRVPIEHGTRLRDAMRAAGLKPDYIVYPGEGHGWQKVENRVDFWTRVERFLARNLKPQE
jgi:acetyl esterase/lipase